MNTSTTAGHATVNSVAAESAHRSGSSCFGIEAEYHGIRVIDCSNEQCNIQPVPAGPLLWTANDIKPEHWQIQLPANAVEEVDQLAKHLVDNPVQFFQRRGSELDYPHTRQCLEQLKSRLVNGPGFAVLQGLDPDRYPDDVTLELFWLLGQSIGKPVAQKWNGEMIYDVRDTGAQYGYGVRGSRTSVELVFHVDNAFGLAVPDYVGLFCVRPAKSGGISRFCSLYTIHERLRASDPASLERLYQPMLFDRQKEHRENAAKVLLAPFFSWRNQRLFARANTSLVRKGYEVAEITMDKALEQALNSVNTICEQTDLWYEAPLERGHMQYLNNHEVGHYRSEFKDHNDPELKRHLYRLWHRETGSVAYDGH